jgi:hypothetical protein
MNIVCEHANEKQFKNSYPHSLLIHVSNMASILRRSISHKPAEIDEDEPTFAIPRGIHVMAHLGVSSA